MPPIKREARGWAVQLTAGGGARGLPQRARLPERGVRLVRLPEIGEGGRLVRERARLHGRPSASPDHHRALLIQRDAPRLDPPVTFLISPGEGLQATGHGMTCCPCR